MAQYPVISPFDDAINWGRSQQTQLMYVGAGGYYTERNATREQGVWVARKGSGTIAYQTSDEGYLYIPPVQYSLTLTGLITGSEVRIYQSGSGTPGELGAELAGVESSGTSFSYNYIYTGDLYANIVIVNIQYEYILLEDILVTSANASIPIQQRIDRNYFNPS
jgi:hypothetical protein